MKKIASLTLTVIFLFAWSLSLKAFTLVKDGKALAEIVMEENHPAGKDILLFREAVKKVSGAELSIVKKAPAKGNRILFKLEKRPILKEDAFTISFPRKGTMLITGTEFSIRWALNHIMEEYWGIVPVFPGAHGTHFPKKKSLSIPEKTFSNEAGFKLSRDLYIEDPQWERALNGKKAAGDFMGHNIWRIFPIQKYSKGKWKNILMPEKNGKRRSPGDPYSAWQVCFSHPESVSEAVKNICDYLKKHPGRNYYSLSVNDLEGYCECKGCLKNNKGSFAKRSKFDRNYRSFSEVYYRWCNLVAEGVSKKYPDVYFGLLAYCGTIDPPSFKLHNKLVPFLCTDLHQTMDPAIMKMRKELFAAWNEKAFHFGLWEYGYGCRHYVVPRLYMGVMKKIFSLKKEFPSLNAFFMEGSNFIGEGPKRYLYGKLLWQPEGKDMEKWLSNWYETCAGKEAAPYLKAYYTIWEDFWNGKEIRKSLWYNSRRNVYFDFSQKNYVFVLPPEKLKKAGELMEKVYKAAMRSGDKNQKIRAERLMLFHKYYEAKIISCGFGLANSKGAMTTPQMAEKYVRNLPRISKYTKLVEEYVKKIAAYKEKEPFRNSKIHLRSFISESLRNPNSPLLLNELLLHIKDPGVAKAIKEIADDPALLPGYKRILKGLKDIEKSPNLASLPGVTQEEDRINWTLYKRVKGIKAENMPSLNGTYRYKLTSVGGWAAAIKCVGGLRPERSYLFSWRITNPLSRNLAIRVMYTNAGRYNFSPKGGSTDRNIVIPPGKSVKTAIYCNTTPGTYAARLYAIASIKKGEYFYIDSIELREIGCSDRKLSEEKIYPSSQAEKEWIFPAGKKGKVIGKNGVLEVNAREGLISRKPVSYDPRKERLRFTMELQGSGSFFVDYRNEKGRNIAQKARPQEHIPEKWTRAEFELHPLKAEKGVSKTTAAISFFVLQNSTLRIRKISCAKIPLD